VRALCHGEIALFAMGMERELARIQLEEWDLLDALNASERALWDLGAEDGSSFDGLSVPLAWELEAAFALMWAVRMRDRLPEFDGTQNTEVEDELRIRLLDPSRSLDEIVAGARLRDVAAVADEIDYLTRYEAIYARERPGWTMGGPDKWLGPLGPESVTCRLRALRWASQI
jgi:hypothetical protein